MAFNIGDRIEVIGVEAGFENSYYAGVVLGFHGELIEVEYEQLWQTKDGPLLRELIEADQVRPYPPAINYNKFEKGNIVDAWYEGGWWEGTVSDVFYNYNNQLRYEVYFEYMKAKKYFDYKPSHVRWHQDWKHVNNRSVWRLVGEIESEAEVESEGEGLVETESEIEGAGESEVETEVDVESVVESEGEPGAEAGSEDKSQSEGESKSQSQSLSYSEDEVEVIQIDSQSESDTN